MIDGEGSYILECKYRNGNTLNYIPRLIISNTDLGIIQSLIDTFKMLNFPFHIWSGKTNPKGKKMYQIRVVGIKRIKKITDFLLKYPSGKKDQIKILNDFCNYRLSIPLKDRINGHKTTYGEIENSFKKQLNQLHIKGAKSSETIRSALETSEDIVRSHNESMS